MLVTSIAHNSKFVMFWYFRSMFDVCTQVPELLEIRSTAEPLGLSSPTVRVHASGPVLTEDDQLRWRRVHRSVLRADPGSGNMGRQEEGGRQRLRGGSHASGSFDRFVRRDIHDDGDLGRWRLHQWYRGGHLHQRPRLVPGALRIRPQPRFWWVNSF